MWTRSSQTFRSSLLPDVKRCDTISPVLASSGVFTYEVSLVAYMSDLLGPTSTSANFEILALNELPEDLLSF